MDEPSDVDFSVFNQEKDDFLLQSDESEEEEEDQEDAILETVNPTTQLKRYSHESLNVIIGELESMEKPLSESTKEVFFFEFVCIFCISSISFFFVCYLTWSLFVAITDDAFIF